MPAQSFAVGEGRSAPPPTLRSGQPSILNLRSKPPFPHSHRPNTKDRPPILSMNLCNCLRRMTAVPLKHKIVFGAADRVAAMLQVYTLGYDLELPRSRKRTWRLTDVWVGRFE